MVNQGRAAAGRAPIGFLNPAIYALGKNPGAHARDFHDVDDGTSNLYYPAVAGYDLATGWGSFIGANLYADLVSSGTMPSITDFSPGTGVSGTTVTVTGAGLIGASSVDFGGVATTRFSVTTDSRLTVTVPMGAKTGPISVTNAFGVGISRKSFVVSSSGSLAITSVMPSDAPVGSTVAILGSGFTGATRVTVGGASVAFTVASTSEITFTVMQDLRGGIVTVTTPLGTAESLTPLNIATWSAAAAAAVPDGTARVLWIRSDGAAGIWSFDALDKMAAVGPTYGPYTSGKSAWNALAIAAAPDGTARILWTRGDGAAGVWTVNASGVMTAIGPTYGPYSSGTGIWQAAGIAVGPDGTTRLLWDRSDHSMGVWTVNDADVVTKIGPAYGPFSDGQGNAWSALGIGAAGDGTARVLWARADGAMGVWSFDASGRQAAVGPVYGPYSDSGGDWYPIALGISGETSSHVLWGRSDGAAGVWNVNASGLVTAYGPVYGPYPQYSPFGLGTSDGQSRLLWVRNDRAAGLWTLDALGEETLIGQIYGPY